MARFNFKRIDSDRREEIDLFNEYGRPNTVILQSVDIFDSEGTELYEHDIIKYSHGGEDLIMEIYYCSGLCRHEVEVLNKNKEIEFGDFILNYLPFSTKIGNSYLNSEYTN